MLDGGSSLLSEALRSTSPGAVSTNYSDEKQLIRDIVTNHRLLDFN